MRSLVQLGLCVFLLQCANNGNKLAKKNAAALSIACAPATQTMNEMTFNNPNLLFSFLPDSILKKPSVLVLQVKQVINPRKLPVTIDVSFSDSLTRWHVNNFTLYPADRPGEFRFRLTSVLEKIQREMKSDKKNICLELKKKKKNIPDKKTDELKIYFGEPAFIK